MYRIWEVNRNHWSKASWKPYECSLFHIQQVKCSSPAYWHVHNHNRNLDGTFPRLRQDPSDSHTVNLDHLSTSTLFALWAWTWCFVFRRSHDRLDRHIDPSPVGPLVHTPFASDDRSVRAPSHCVRQVNRVSLVLLFFRIASILEDPKDLWVADETTLCGNILSGLGGLVLSLIYFAFALEYSVFWGLFWIPELCIIYKTLGWDSGNNPNQINSTPSGHLYCWRSITGALIIN